MANGEQMRLAIKEATDTVAKKGYASREVTTKAVFLAGFGYLAELIIDSKPKGWNKAFWVPVLVGIGAVLLGAGQALLGV